MFLTKKNPIWTAKDGREFFKPEEFEDSHLQNMIPFLARDIFNINVNILHIFDDDERSILQQLLDKRISLAGSLLHEAQRRELTS